MHDSYFADDSSEHRAVITRARYNTSQRHHLPWIPEFVCRGNNFVCFCAQACASRWRGELIVLKRLH
jgi:hypothetical protein